MNKVTIKEKSDFISSVGPFKTREKQLNYIWFKSRSLQLFFNKNYFLSPIPATWRCHAEEKWKFKIVWCLNIEYIESLPKNGADYPIIFDDSCEEIPISNTFTDIATAGKHRGLSDIYMKHKLFQHCNLGWDVEHQTMHFVLSNFL